MGYRDGNYDVPDTGSAGNGEVRPMVLTCTACTFQASSRSAMQVIGRAQAHSAATGHAISYRGAVQVWSQKQ